MELSLIHIFYINKETQRVTKETLKSLVEKDVLLVFPSQHKTNKTVQILKTPKTESSIRKVFLPKKCCEYAG